MKQKSLDIEKDIGAIQINSDHNHIDSISKKLMLELLEQYGKSKK